MSKRETPGVYEPDEVCICKHRVDEHTPRECSYSYCSCTYPRPIWREDDGPDS